jgi:hypothetical protein
MASKANRLKTLSFNVLSSFFTSRTLRDRLRTHDVPSPPAPLDRLTASDITRNPVAVFYCAGEALSILENAVAAGLPVPEFLREALVRLNEKKFAASVQTSELLD